MFLDGSFLMITFVTDAYSGYQIEMTELIVFI
jgi:hypothetical protein